MAKDRYPMGPNQPAQVDCRCTTCIHHRKQTEPITVQPCKNVSPAITLNPDGSFVCWSREYKSA